MQQEWSLGFAVARYLQAGQPGEHSRSNGQAHMLGTDMQQCQISPSGSSKGSIQDVSGKISNEPSERAPASFQLKFMYKHMNTLSIDFPQD